MNIYYFFLAGSEKIVRSNYCAQINVTKVSQEVPNFGTISPAGKDLAVASQTEAACAWD